MTNAILLDTGPLGLLARKHPRSDVSEWVRRNVLAGAVYIVPEVSDFEVRRSLILHSLNDSLDALDELQLRMEYAPISTPVMRQAAELWADARRRGRRRRTRKGWIAMSS